MIQLQSDFVFTNDTPYLTLTGELWRVFREIFKEIWPRYIESALYNDRAVYSLHNTPLGIKTLWPPSWPCVHSMRTARRIHQSSSHERRNVLCTGWLSITQLSTSHKGRHFCFSVYYISYFSNSCEVGEKSGNFITVSPSSLSQTTG